VAQVAAQTVAADDDARYGWGKRSYSWEFAVSAQRELMRGVSINGGYFRRWFGNFLVTDDLTHTAADYDRYSITQSAIPPAPASAGGATLPSSIYTTDFFNQKVGTAAGSNNFIGRTDTFFPGSNMIDHWNGFEFGINARLPHGIIFQGGFGTGKQVTDNCDIVDPASAGKFGDRSPLVELLATPPIAGTFPASLNSCHIEQAWLTQAGYHRIIGDLGALPALVAIHGIVAANDSSDSSNAKIGHVAFQIAHVAQATLRHCVTPIGEGVDKHPIKAIALSKIKQRLLVVHVAVDAAGAELTAASQAPAVRR
jgi:hypothetical protein